MAIRLDPADPDVRAAADSSRDILVRLGAMPFVERLDGALRREAHAPMREPAAEATERSSARAS
jgi:hypothetical protein